VFLLCFYSFTVFAHVGNRISSLLLILVIIVKKQMIYIAVLCNPKITAEPLYNTPLFIGPYAAANNTALLA